MTYLSPAFCRIALASVFLGLAAKAQALPMLTLPASIEVDEGDSGSKRIELRYVLDAPSPADVSFRLSVGWLSFATPGADFAEFPPRQVRIPAGATSASVFVEVYGDTHTEIDHGFKLDVENLSGATFASGNVGTTIGIIDDDSNDIADWVVVDDQFDVMDSKGWVELAFASNDQTHRDWYDSAALTFELIDPPSHGEVRDWGGGKGRYFFEPGFIGAVQFRYRLCLEGTCHEANAIVNVLPFDPQQLGGASHSGYREVFAANAEGRVLTATPLVAPVRHELSLGIDRSPQDAWDGDDGTASRLVPVPAWSTGQPRERIVRIEVDEGRLFAGIDGNADGRLSPAEASCPGASGICHLRIQVGDSPGAWIMRVHNRFDSVLPVRALVHDISVIPTDGSLTATGPGRVTDAWGETVHLGWNAPTMVGGDVHAGVVRVTAPDGAWLGDVPVKAVRWDDNTPMPIPLVSGRAQAMRLGPARKQQHMFIDVPAGAQRLRVDVSGGAPGGTGFHVVRQSASLDPATSSIPAAPDLAQAAATGNTAVAGGTVVIQGGTLAAGRWHIVPDNNAAQPVSLTVTATVEALAPVVRPGSYFNPARSGSGVFLYPAGGQWTGLWYTYFADGRPTWYYLQGAAPGENGLWYSLVYRSTWNGKTSALSRVGEVALTPVGPDAFTLTYTIDGVAGSQPMQPLGRGCPMQDGLALDISSTWFDPDKPGTGYSVQMWPNYEFHSAFVYDNQGVPMFLVAELGRFGGTDATLVLERLAGACPTCTWKPSTRAPVGTLVRRLVGNTLGTVGMDAVWRDYNRAAMSTWSAQDSVEMLGGPDTSQTCTP